MTDNSSKDGSKKSALDLWLSKSKKSTPEKGIKKMPENAKTVLSHGQERLWLLDQIYPNQNLYNYAHRYCIDGPIHLDILVQSFQLLAKENEVLRSNYEIVGATCVQLVKHERIPIELYNLSKLNSIDQKKEIELQKEHFLTLSFDLSKDPLFQLFIFDLGANKYELFLVLHHIIGDGWSLGIINEMVSKFYRQLSSQESRTPHDERLQYKDVAFWQKNQKVKEKDLDYWTTKLSGKLPVLDLPKSSVKAENPFEGNSFVKALAPALSKQLNELSKERNTTPYVLFLTAYKVFLSKYCKQNDILVASPFSNRDTKELEKIIGFFNETVVLRTQIQSDITFIELVESVKQSTFEALEHKNVPFDTLVKELKIERQIGENPIFQTMFLYNKANKQLDLGEGIESKEQMLDLGTSKFDLTLFVNETSDHLELVFEHRNCFDSEIILQMSQHFEQLLQNIIKEPNQKISELSLLTDKEQQLILTEWNNNNVPIPSINSIQELIFKKEYETKIAISHAGQSINYLELDQWSSQIAIQLLQKGVSTNDFVGLYCHRSVDMIVGMMGII
ncbi:MAG: hypothetical protein JKY48_15180 [Flavobacteriales bacterium]|nr:hypothetical protein [Flavobacteriales bacterium]